MLGEAVHTKSESTVSSLLYIFRSYFFSSLLLLWNFLETSNVIFLQKNTNDHKLHGTIKVYIFKKDIIKKSRNRILVQ